jgi:hypothetical protein
LQKNAVQLHYINKSCLIFKINKKLTILKNKFYNIKTLIKLKFFFNFILFIKITVFIVKKIPSTPSIRFKKKSNMYFLNKKIFKFTVTLRSTGGRNNSGQVVTRHRKQILLRKFIKIDQLRCSLLLPARVKMLSKQLLHK